MSILSGRDERIVSRLRAAHIFEDIYGHRLDQRNGVILVTCGDADRFPDLFKFKANLQVGRRLDQRIHVLSLNGGALRLAHNSPTNKSGHSTDIDLMDDIIEASETKHINVVALYIHSPCGKAYHHRLPLLDCLKFLMSAKTRLKETRRALSVACFCHVDYGDRRQRSYFLSQEKFERWLEKQQTPA